MRIVKALKDIQIYKGLKAVAGQEYVMAGAVFKQLNKISPGSMIESRSFEEVFNPARRNLSNITPDDEVFLFRSGGIGDVMFMFPLIKFLKMEFGCNIKAATSPMYLDVFFGNPYVDKLVFMPFPLEEMTRSKYHIMFEGVIEDPSKSAHSMNAFDLFLLEGGVDPSSVKPENKIPRLFISPTEEENIKSIIENLNLSGRINVGIQLRSSSPIRSFPFEKMVSVISALFEKGFNVFIFGSEKQGGEIDKVIELVDKNCVLKEGHHISKNLVSVPLFSGRLRDSIVMASLMDIMVAPDSSFIHIAGGLGIPVVGIYGCFPSILRMKYYKNAIGIDAGVACAPSFTHGHMPCYRGDPSPCFSVISVENVLDAVDHLLFKKKIDMKYPKLNRFVNGEPVKTMFDDPVDLEEKA